MFNAPAAFDIETTSTIINGNKSAWCYCWQMMIENVFIFSRTLEEFREDIQEIAEIFELDESRRLIVYVHNLSFEFQFIRKYFSWSKVFALEEREVVSALTSYGIEFRCSYILTGYKLAKLAEQLKDEPCRKLSGDLDYKLVRTPKTPLKLSEVRYCYNDVLIVTRFIRERIKRDGDISKIPLTKTGYVRNECRVRCLPPHAKGADLRTYQRYSTVIKQLMISPSEYEQLKRAFQGGFTHANAEYVGKTLNNVASFDFTSSYPAQMIAGYYPMSQARLIRVRTLKRLRYYLDNYCCLFDIKLQGVTPKVWQDNYLSASRCKTKHAILNNGRIVSADEIVTTMTEIDFEIFESAYNYEYIEIGDFRIYERGPLPLPLVLAILDFYGAKTELKGVKGMEAEYLTGKENVNSIYGMMVTDVLRDEIDYNADTWGRHTPDAADALAKYNTSSKRFLFYPWGVWVTAHARRALWSGILAVGHDYVYSDTDSIKVLDPQKHTEYIERYNHDITARLEAVLDLYKISHDRIRPKTVKGVEKPLGVWDFEGVYDAFKTLGAKRYMTKHGDEYSLTVSGLEKKTAMTYIKELAKKRGVDPFDVFEEGLYVPPGHTGKLTHTYIDDEIDAAVVDYLGGRDHVRALSSVHLSESDYSLSLAQEFKDYLLTIERR